MKRSILTVTCFFLICFLSFGSAGASESEKSDASAANNTFGFELFQKIIRQQEGKNVFISPYSISTALAMTWSGARGKTAEEMAGTLHFDVFGENIHPLFHRLKESIAQSDGEGCRLNVADALWGQEGYGFRKEFLDRIEKYYSGGFNTVDFIGDTDKAATRINQWASENTAGKIKDLISGDDIDMDTRLVLTNAIYFKGDWTFEFDKKMTRKKPFYVTPEKPVEAEMMFNEEDYRYGEPDDGLQVLELPYKGDDLSMVVLLPKHLPDLEKALNPDHLNNWLAGLQPEKVKVYLPRFKFQTRYYLGDYLKSMGIVEAFSDRADFSGMTGSKDLYIGKVIHQADIEVNEKGTEAAAATAVVMTWKSVPMTVTFNADRPFLFLIRHKPTNSILFMGRVMNPA